MLVATTSGYLPYDPNDVRIAVLNTHSLWGKMRVFFTMLGQLAYGGLAQHSAILVKNLRDLGCEVLPVVGMAPPHNDEVPLPELHYTFDAFNVADYVLRDQPAPVRWLLGPYGRRQIATAHPRKVRSTRIPLNIDYKRLVERIFFKPEGGDIRKVDKQRRAFRPDIDYVCELSLAGYFSQFTDLGIPLVVAAQGYEVCQRHGIDVISAIKRNENMIDVVLSGSQANVNENIGKDLPFLVSRTRVIHYGIVNDETYEMSAAEAATRSARFARRREGEFVLTALSRIDVEKGTDLALHALRILLNQGLKVRLRLVGDTVAGTHFRTTIRDKITLMDLTDHVDFIGFVEEKADKVALLKTSDAFLAPFIKSEPFGLVYCEAMAAGLPVIAPDNGAGPEIIHWNGYRAGLVYRSQDTGQMADAVHYLIDHADEARAMGEAGRRAVAEHFNARRMAVDILRLFEEAIERRRAGTRSHHLVTC